ncbi:MAG: hypothetical protein IAG10_11095 [Planctomycetaceae bacterium]|nr:hypothetical protein [Planctomycetaceae bacterium]
MPTKRRSTWKIERASVTVKGHSRPRSNKFSGMDRDQRPAPHTRQKVWVGGYTKADGTQIQGHFRSTGLALKD